MTDAPQKPRTPRQKLVEALAAFALATTAAAVLYRVRVLDEYFHAAVAALFLYLPAFLVWRGGEELERYGMVAAPLLRNLALVLLAVVVIFPAFFFGFAIWQKLACQHPLLRPLAPGPCVSGLHELALRLPLRPWRFAAAELVVVALPEEFFFRGYLQGRLAEVWPAAQAPSDCRPAGESPGLGGAPVGWAVVVASGLFALCHLAVQGSPATLAVFFPGLVFGWMRARTGSVLPGTLFHALCNLYIETLHRSFFG